MKIIRTPKAMAVWSEKLRREGVTIGFVPTMGALHDGHRALIRAARLQCDALVVSIFVNPAQFAPTEDLTKYPRPIARDRALCRSESVDACFEPTAQAMYPEGFHTTVTVPGIARRWEGESRPHHFGGVAVVVTKLFGMVRPHFALFGQKDYQQTALVQQLVSDLNLGVKIQAHPIIREQDGLAMSSRNVYLNADERRIAPILFLALRAGAHLIEGGTGDVVAVERAMRQTVEQARAMQIEYLAVCDPTTLDPLTVVTGRVVLLGAVRIGAVRLIDNVLAKLGGEKGRRRAARSRADGPS